MTLSLPSALSSIQSAIWLEQQLFAGKPIHNTGQVVSVRGSLRADLFETALRETIAESPGLQLQPRFGAAPLELLRLDFQNEKDPLRSAELWMASEMRRAIPLDGHALFRFALLRIGKEHHLWFQKFHHIIMDATSRRLLSERTARHYRALRFSEPLVSLDAASPEDLLNFERQYLASEAHAVDRRYWLDTFANWPGPLLDGNRQNSERERSGVHSRLEFKLRRPDFERLNESARRLGSSASRVIIAISYAAFARVYDRYDLVLGVELANRSDPRSRQAIGLLAWPVPMRISLDHNATLADVVRQVERVRAQNYPHRRFRVQDLARELDVTRKGQHGLFDIICNYVPATYDFAFEGPTVEIRNLSYSFAVPWAVTVADTGNGRDLDVTIDFDRGLVPEDTATQLAFCLQELLTGDLDEQRPLGRLQVMPQAALQRALDFATGDTVSIEDTTLSALCAAQAQRTPDAVAVICGGQQVSYRTLHERATRLAHRLAAEGVRPGVAVGVALPRTPDLIVTVLAIHKAGGAYLALDPSYPAQRIRFMIADATLQLIVTDSSLAPLFADSGARLLMELDAGIDDETLRMTPPAADDLAYVLYTSGSTGRPKAVGIEHRNLVNFISWARSIVSDHELDGVLCSTSLNFDLSALEIFLPLAFGGYIILVENLLALQSAPERHKIRFINTGPSLMDALLRANALPQGVSTVILAGEKLSRALADRIFQAAPDLRLLNCYGPTETTIYSSWSTVDRATDLEPTIGRPIWNTTLQVLDSAGALRPPGQEGELAIGGAGVARGYLGRPELTAERFLPNRYGPGRVYRTGDRVRWRSDGELEFLGRTDEQIKINGIRVEPGEIEAALAAIPGIASALVTLSEEPRGGHSLTAYLVPASPSLPSTDDVRGALEKQLPRSMIPTSYVWLERMPLTPNGKIDRKALPRPARRELHARASRSPQSPMEHELAHIWEDLLEVSPIDAGADFFDLGGDSLALVSLFATVEARFGRHLTIDILSGGLTIEGLARLLSSERQPDQKSNPVFPLQPQGDLPPFFCVHGIGGDIVHLQRLARHMGTHRPFYGIRRTPEASPNETIPKMAERYVTAMLAHQPEGPFYIGGHSFGAVVAYEIARQLADKGHQIGLLAILDQRKPGWRLTARAALPVLHKIMWRVPGRIRREIAEIPAGDRIPHIHRTLRRWSTLAMGRRPDAASMFDMRRSKQAQVDLFDANLRALRSYRPGPLRAPITLLRAEEQLLSTLALDATLGWNGIAQTEIRVRTVPGTHGSITIEPFVQDLAKMLCDELDQSLARSCKPVDRS